MQAGMHQADWKVCRWEACRWKGGGTTAQAAALNAGLDECNDMAEEARDDVTDDDAAADALLAATTASYSAGAVGVAGLLHFGTASCAATTATTRMPDGTAADRSTSSLTLLPAAAASTAAPPAGDLSGAAAMPAPGGLSALLDLWDVEEPSAFRRGTGRVQTVPSASP